MPGQDFLRKAPPRTVSQKLLYDYQTGWTMHYAEHQSGSENAQKASESDRAKIGDWSADTSLEFFGRGPGNTFLHKKGFPGDSPKES